MTVDLTGTTVRVVHPTHCPELGPICAIRDEPPQLHDQRFWVAELRPVVEHQLTAVLSAEVQVPVRWTVTTIQYRRLDGTPFAPDYENIHHRNETLAGIGDPWVSARLLGRAAGVTFAGRLGVTVPLGRTEPDPFALGALGQPHQHVQFGFGTFAPLAGLDVYAPFAGTGLAYAYAQLLLPLAENHHGYRAGARASGGLEGSIEVGGRLRLVLTADVFHEQPERWNGVVQQDGNVGRTDLLVGAAANLPVGRFALRAGFKVPVYQHFVAAGPEAGQLTYPAIANVSVGTVFGDR